jgi:hydrogenase expression/formation protein HypC
MCVTAPQKIIKIDGNLAIVENDKKIDISPLPDVKIGDWILAHAGLAIKKISAEDAETVNKILYGK